MLRSDLGSVSLALAPAATIAAPPAALAGDLRAEADGNLVDTCCGASDFGATHLCP